MSEPTQLRPADASSAAVLAVVVSAMIEEMSGEQLLKVAERLETLPFAGTDNGAAVLAVINHEAAKPRGGE